MLNLISLVLFRIAKWALGRNEFANINVNDILFNREACMSCSPSKRRIVVWSPPSLGLLNFNVNEAARAKPGLVGIGKILRNDSALCM